MEPVIFKPSNLCLAMWFASAGREEGRAWHPTGFTADTVPVIATRIDEEGELTKQRASGYYGPNPLSGERERQRETETERQTERERDRDRQTDRQRQRETESNLVFYTQSTRRETER